MIPLRVLLIALLFCYARHAAFPADAAAPAARDPEAEALVRELLLQRPESMQVRCRLKTRGPDRRSEVLIRYSIISGDQSWQSVYETEGITPSEQLVVIHRDFLPNQYVYRRSADGGEPARPVVLNGSEATVPFARSEFWLSDLGLEFLRWPEQRLLRDRKITMRSGRPCKILESTNPNPGQGYARVVSWIDAEFGGLIYAEAYDAKRRLVKVFSLKGFKKIDGAVHVKEMEIRNEKDDSRTRLEFLFED